MKEGTETITYWSQTQIPSSWIGRGLRPPLYHLYVIDIMGSGTL